MMIRKLIVAAVVALTAGGAASAQYYELANRLPQLISPALSGSFNYKGYVDASYLGGVGSQRADFLEITTTQGFKYSSWFFMGVGAGVDVAFAHVNDGWSANRLYSYTNTGVMLPLYTDFRFNTNLTGGVSFFADIRLGAAFLIGKNYLRVGDGYLTNSESFYLKPTVGVRIPVSKNGRQAVNVGLSYQLITSSYWYTYSRNSTLNAFGATVGFEW